MFAPTQRTRRFFDAHIAPHLTLTAADAARAEEEEREREARGLRPRLVVHIEVDHAFFHCSKAYLRSQLWQPSTWPDQSYRVCFGPYFFHGAQEREALDADIERHYEQVREAVAGKRVEPD